MGIFIAIVLTAALMLTLGWYFDRQDRLKKEAALSPELRRVFDGLFGSPEQAAAIVARAALATSSEPVLPDVTATAIAILLSEQVSNRYSNIHDAFGELMLNPKAAGYVFGFHDGFLQKMGLATLSHPKRGLAMIEQSYRRLFGPAGRLLLERSLQLQDERTFRDGRLVGGSEVVEYLEQKRRAHGLSTLLRQAAPATN